MLPSITTNALVAVPTDPVTGAPARLLAINRYSGALTWATTLPALTGDPTVANGLVFVPQGWKGIAAYKAPSGALVWSAPVRCQDPRTGAVEARKAMDTVAIANGKLFVGCWVDAEKDNPVERITAMKIG